MYCITGLFFLTVFGDVLARTYNPEDVIWYPIEDIKNGYTSSHGYVYLTQTSNGLPYQRKGRSLQGEPTWNDFTTERDNSNDPIVFPFEDILESCENSCPRTPEYNPVCGSDRRTYHNMAALKCSQLCGYGVRFVHYGNCGRGFPLIFRPTPRPPRQPRTRPDDVNGDNW